MKKIITTTLLIIGTLGFAFANDTISTVNSISVLDQSAKQQLASSQTAILSIAVMLVSLTTLITGTKLVINFIRGKK